MQTNGRQTASKLFLLPADLPLERMVLGAMMLDPEQLGMALAAMSARDFSADNHRSIYGTMQSLYESGTPVDRITLVRALMDSGDLDRVGGIGYLTDLDNGLPELLHLDEYIARLQELSTKRQALELVGQIENRIAMPGEDSADLLAWATRAIAELGHDNSAKGWAAPGEIIRDYPGGLQMFLTPSRGGSGLETPWQKLNDVTCGLQPGDLIVVAGRPSMGKSIVAMQLAQHAAAAGKPAAVFSLEMSKESLLRRLIAATARIDLGRIRSGFMDKDERFRAQRAAADLAELPLFIDDTGTSTIAMQSAALRRLPQAPGIIVIDYLQLMSTTGRAENRNQELSVITRACKNFATEYKCPVVLLSQLNRECERDSRRPQLSDLRDSGSIEQDADIVLFVHRWEQYQKFADRPEHHGAAELILAKQRNGPTCKLNMVFQKHLQRFDTAATISEND